MSSAAKLLHSFMTGFGTDPHAAQGFLPYPSVTIVLWACRDSTTTAVYGISLRVGKSPDSQAVHAAERSEDGAIEPGMFAMRVKGGSPMIHDRTPVNPLDSNQLLKLKCRRSLEVSGRERL